MINLKSCKSILFIASLTVLGLAIAYTIYFGLEGKKFIGMLAVIISLTLTSVSLAITINKSQTK